VVPLYEPCRGASGLRNFIKDSHRPPGPPARLPWSPLLEALKMGWAACDETLPIHRSSEDSTDADLETGFKEKQYSRTSGRVVRGR